MIKQKLCGYFKHVYADFNDSTILTKIDETDISFTPQYENCQILPIDNFPERDFMLKVNKGGYYKPFCPNSDLGYQDERTSRNIRAVDFFIRLKNKNDDGTIPLFNLTNGSDINVHLYLQDDEQGITRLMFKNLVTGDIGTQPLSYSYYNYNKYVNGDWTHVQLIIYNTKQIIDVFLDYNPFCLNSKRYGTTGLEKIFTREFTKNDSSFLEFYDECELTDIITTGFDDSIGDELEDEELRNRTNVFQYPYISNVNIKYQSTKTPNNSYYKPIVAPLFGIVIDEMHCSPFDSVTTYKVSIHFIGMYKPKTYGVSWSNGKVGDTVTINAKDDFIWARVTDFNTGESNVSGLYLDEMVYPTLFYTDFWHNPTTAITNNTTYFRNTSKGVSYFTNLYDDNVDPSIGDLEKFVGDELYKDISLLTNPITGKKDGYLYLPMSCGKREINENTIDWYQKQKESFYTNNLLVNVNSADNNSPQNIGVFCHGYTSSTYTDCWDFCFYASKPRDGMLIATIGRGKTGSVLDDTLIERGVQIRLKPSTDQLMVVYFVTNNITGLKRKIFYYDLNGTYKYNEENHFAICVKYNDSSYSFISELFFFLNGKKLGSFYDIPNKVYPFFEKEIFSVNQKAYSDIVALSFENVHPFLGDKPNEQGFDYFDPLDYYRISKVRKLETGVNRYTIETDYDLPRKAFFGSFNYNVPLVTRGINYKPAIDVELYPRYDDGNMFVKGITHFEANDKLISEKETSDIEFGYSGQIIEKVKAKGFENKYLPMTDVNMVSMNQKNITSNVPFYDNSSPYRSESELYRDFSFEFNLNKNLVSDTTGKIPVISLWTVNKRFISSSATNCSMKLAYDETENNYYIYSSLYDSDSYTIEQLKQKFKGSKPFKIQPGEWLKVDYINMCTKYQLSTTVTDEKSNAYDVCCVFVNDELVYSGRFYYYSTAEEQGANIGKDTTVNFLQTQYETGFGTDNSIVYSVRDLKLYPTTQSIIYVEELEYV